MRRRPLVATEVVHAVVLVAVIIATCVLAFAGKVPQDTVGVVFGGIVGVAGGRALPPSTSPTRPSSSSSPEGGNA